MRSPRRFPLSWPLTLLLALITMAAPAGCIFRGVTVSPITNRDTATVQTPVKAHLLDGETVVFEHGVRVAHDTAFGRGLRYELAVPAVAGGDSVAAIPLDSVAAMESFVGHTNEGKSVVVSTLATVGAVGAAGLLAVALFGSCPTIYSDSAGTAALEAEGFSYSISPLLERRDLHRLRAQPDAGGMLSLEVRNEALETHYINQLELLGVTHSRSEYVLPDAANRPLVVRDIIPVAHASDRAGNDVTATLSSGDTVAFHSDPGTVSNVTAADLDDWIDIDIPVPANRDSVALLFDMRNSLLNTVLFYDEMLRPQGARAVDFEAHDLNDISRMMEIGRWYGSRMGMHIAVRTRSGWKAVAYIPDSGPIAWQQIAAVIPVIQGDTLHVRLSFVADQWRIRTVRVATAYRHPHAARLPIASVITARSVADSVALSGVRTLDGHYLATSPGQRFTVRFATGPAPHDSTRTFLLATEGYYTEWIRGSWIRQAVGPRPFVPSDSTLALAVHRWTQVQPEFERRFATSRIPVR